LGWVVPEVGASKDLFPGAGAVVGMIRRAQASAGNLLRFAAVATVETRIHRAALTAWSAERGERAAQGRESAVFDVSGGRIASVRFHPENVAGDPAFWAAAVQRT